MTVHEMEKFISSVRWRHVRMIPVGEGLTPEVAEERWGKHKHVTPDPHEYVIRDWREVDTDEFDAFVRLIKAERLPRHVSGAVPARLRDEEPLPRDRRLVLLVHLPEDAQPGAG